MKIALLHAPACFGDYAAEICETWGLTCYQLIQEQDLASLSPTDIPALLLPAGHYDRASCEAIITYVNTGGALVCLCPQSELSDPMGFTYVEDKTGHHRLRITCPPAAGIAGTALPVVGKVKIYEPRDDAQIRAWLSLLNTYEKNTPAIMSRQMGKGQVICFSFDLLASVCQLRQGDPHLAEIIPPGDSCARPGHLASDLGGADSGWVPFADLQARLLVDTLIACLPAPVPLISHLPANANAIILYSGDEDAATRAETEKQFTDLTAENVRMNLYLIPDGSASTREDAHQDGEHHDIGVHPDLLHLSGASIQDRVDEYRAQLERFSEKFQLPLRSARNHCTAWAGYLELMVVAHACGLRMDSSYFTCSGYMRNRAYDPYGAFGMAMPMRFVQPTGEMIDIYEQPTHLSDDCWFQSGDDYSADISPDIYDDIVERILTDQKTQYHMPYGVNIHPGNYGRFSSEQSASLIRQSKALDLPIWSFDQWLDFVEARRRWRISDWQWQNQQLRFTVQGDTEHHALSLLLPAEHMGSRLKAVSVEDQPIAYKLITRYRQSVAELSLPPQKTFNVAANYETKSA